MRKTRPHHVYSHCKGAGEKLTAHPHFQLRVPRMAAQGDFLPGVSRFERFSSRGEKAPSPLPPAASERGGLLGLLLPFKWPLTWTPVSPLLHLAGLHPFFGALPPVAAIQAVDAAGPDGAATGGLGHGEGLGEEILCHQGPW